MDELANKVLLKQKIAVDGHDLMVTVEMIDKESAANWENSEQTDMSFSSSKEYSKFPSASAGSENFLEGANSPTSKPTAQGTYRVDEVVTPVGELGNESDGVCSDAGSINTINADDDHNPLLKEDNEYDVQDLQDAMSTVSVDEFIPTDGDVKQLHEDDPRSILTWNSSGIVGDPTRKDLWDRFKKLVESLNPDIVVLQNVKLCQSDMTGVFPRVISKGSERGATVSYEQKMRDANLLNSISRDVFKGYYSVVSLAPWKIGGQIVFVKKQFKCIKQRFSLNMKISPKYHHPEGRCIMLQFRSYYLLCLMSPHDGWSTSNWKQRLQWDRELGRMIHEYKEKKAAILIGNLNCAPEDIDLSNPERLKTEASPVLHESANTGYPGCRQSDREGLNWIMKAGRLVDVFRMKHPYSGKPSEEENLQYTSLVYLGDKTRCAIRNHLTLMTNYFLPNVEHCGIIGKPKDLGITGWRHLPQLLLMTPSRTKEETPANEESNLE